MEGKNKEGTLSASQNRANILNSVMTYLPKTKPNAEAACQKLITLHDLAACRMTFSSSNLKLLLGTDLHKISVRLGSGL